LAKASFISFSRGFDTLSNSEGCLIRPSEAKPHSTYSELATDLVKLRFSVNLLVVSVKRLAN